MRNFIFIFLIIIFSFFNRNLYAKNDLKIINSSLAFQYGMDRYLNQDYFRAITEFKRFIFFNSNNKLKYKAKYYIGLSYLRGGDYKNSRKVFYNIIENGEGNYIEDAYLKVADTYLEENFKSIKIHKHYDFTPSFFSPDYYLQYLNRFTDGKYSDEVKSKILFTYLLNCDYKKASYIRAYFTFKEKKYKSITENLSLEIDKIKNISYKSKTIATLLSIFIPGGGQIYAGEVKEGFIALLVNTSMAFLSVYSFINYSKFVGVFLGYYELTFYFGNISNARNAVYKYNENIRNKYRKYLINLYWKRF